MAKQPFTMESNLDKIILKIREKPQDVMGKIGGQLVREIKANSMKSVFSRRYKFLAGMGKKSKSGIQWAYGWSGKRDITSIQIGWKVAIPGMLGKIMSGQEPDPIKSVVVKNADVIQQLIGAALDEIRSE